MQTHGSNVAECQASATVIIPDEGPDAQGFLKLREKIMNRVENVDPRLVLEERGLLFRTESIIAV